MADDPSVLRLLSAAETAGAKTILVGDHRQLGAVGPGGTLEVVIARHSHAVHVLDENVRQADPAERAALAELRAGDVETAVDWYRDNDRIRVAPDREQALDGMVTAWAADVAAGRDTAMYAWRKANVAALNTRARTAMTAAGRLTGPELKIDGQAFQSGDRIVTLAPGAGGQTVTSERGTVTHVDPAARSLAARMDDGRTQTFGPDDLGANSLALGYATTVHRSQGSTVDAAHMFADGGGRELGYVGMSRARHASHVHLVADNPAQAVEDLARDWSAERRQIWAIDTGTPQPAPVAHPLEVEASAQTPAALKAALGRARLAAERQALISNLKAAVGAEGIDSIPPQAVERVQLLDRHIKALDRRLAPVTQQQRPTPGVVRVPPHQVHHAPPRQPGGPSVTPGM